MRFHKMMMEEDIFVTMRDGVQIALYLAYLFIPSNETADNIS